MILLGVLFSIFVAWLLASPVVTAPVIGSRTVKQLTESLRALTIKLGEVETMKLDEIWSGPDGESLKPMAGNRMIVRKGLI
jgi:aryl-alcohol dehydrogenase-like predicted oxidoreductase